MKWLYLFEKIECKDLLQEIGSSEQIYQNPMHPYTQALLSAMPSMDPDRRIETPPLTGDPPNPINPPSGCTFHPRCAKAFGPCPVEKPPVIQDADGRVECHLYA